MRDLLDLSKIEAGESQPQFATISVRDLLTMVVKELRPQVETKGLKLSVDAPVTLPWVMVDRLQIERVVSNLVINALRHTKQGEIKIRAEPRDNFVAVSIHDTGSAIPGEYLPPGLGLTISKSIVAAYAETDDQRSRPRRTSNRGAVAGELTVEAIKHRARKISGGEQESWQQNSNVLSSAVPLGLNKRLTSVFQRKQP